MRSCAFGFAYVKRMFSPEAAPLDILADKVLSTTNKHGDSKSDVLLCYDTKFKS